MDEFQIKLNVLKELMQSKIKYQNQVFIITENQELVYRSKGEGLSSSASINESLVETSKTILNETENDENIEAKNEFKALIREMNSEKSNIIENIIHCDTVFNTVFSEISEHFEEQAKLYKIDIKELQELIKVSMSLDIKIRVLEDTNKELVDRFTKNIKRIVSDKSKDELLKHYKLNTKQSY